MYKRGGILKIIAMDMDGTLLDSTHEIPKENIDAIKKAQEKGIYAVISTGRVYEHVIGFIKKSGFTPDFIISANGALITDKDENDLFSKPLPKETVRQAVEYLHHNDFFYSLGTPKGMISPNDGLERLEREAKELREKGLDDSKLYGFIGFLKDLSKTNNLEQNYDYNTLYNISIPVFSIPVIGFSPERLQKGRTELSHLENVTLDSSAFNNFEIVNKEASKGNAIEFLLNKLDISRNEAMAIGDNFNDVSMFNVVKYSIAMGNAPEEIKEKCYFTTKTNVEFGVAHAIEKFCL